MQKDARKVTHNILMIRGESVIRCYPRPEKNLHLLIRFGASPAEWSPVKPPFSFRSYVSNDFEDTVRYAMKSNGFKPAPGATVIRNAPDIPPLSFERHHRRAA